MIALLFGLALSSSAQEESRREMPSAEQMTERMKTRLELTDEQYKSVYAANEEMIKMIEEAGGREADQETRTKIRKQHLMKLNEVLTPEQMGKLKEANKTGSTQKKQIHRVEKK